MPAVLSGAQTSAPSYVFNVPNGPEGPHFRINPLVTTGDVIPLLEDVTLTQDSSSISISDTFTYAFPGKPDGIGLFSTGELNFVFVNHEIASNAPFPSFSSPPGTAITTDISNTFEGQINGARVSLLVFDENFNIIGGRNLIDQAVIVDPITGEESIFVLNPETGNYEDADGSVLNLIAHDNFALFCSGFLADEGFFDVNGDPAPLYLSGEETIEGIAWAHTTTGSSFALQGVGAYAHENVVVAEEYRPAISPFTAILSPDDNSAGPGDTELYLFVGESDPTSENFLERNGLSSSPEDFQLYVLRVLDENGEVFVGETMPEGAVFTTEWVAVPDEVALGLADELLNASEELTAFVNGVDENGVLNSTNFRRPEDLHEDPNNPGTFYFVTTGDISGQGEGAPPLPPGQGIPLDNGVGMLHRITLELDENGVPLNGEFEAVLTGGFGNGASYDNIVVDSNGNVLIQEDVTADGDEVFLAEGRTEARVHSYNIASDSIIPLLQIDQTAEGDIFDTGIGDWETSGIVEVDPNAAPGQSSYLFGLMAHSIDADNFDENSAGFRLVQEIFGGLRLDQGGQLLLVEPAPVAATNIGGDDDEVVMIGDEGLAAGGLGADQVIGGDGDDILLGDLVTVSLSTVGQGGVDEIYGGAGNDFIRGQEGDDFLFGNVGDDVIFGDAGDDVIVGGLGNDLLAGDSTSLGSVTRNTLASGSDTFVIGVGLGSDIIFDFTLGQDFISLAGELTFDELDIMQSGSNTLVAANGEILATLFGVPAVAITESSFVAPPFPVASFV